MVNLLTIQQGMLNKEDEMEVIGMARDGNEAFDIFIKYEPDVALLDVIMPHLDGIGFQKKLPMQL